MLLLAGLERVVAGDDPEAGRVPAGVLDLQRVKRGQAARADHHVEPVPLRHEVERAADAVERGGAIDGDQSRHHLRLDALRPGPDEAHVIVEERERFVLAAERPRVGEELVLELREQLGVGLERVGVGRAREGVRVGDQEAQTGGGHHETTIPSGGSRAQRRRH